MRTKKDKSSSEDETPERDVTYHLIWLLIYHWTTTHLYSVVLRNIFEVTRRPTYLMDVGLRKATCVFCYYPLSVFLVKTILLPVVSRFIQDAPLTQRDREHTASRNRVKCCINVRHIAFEKACKWWIPSRSFKVTAVGAISLAIYDFLLIFHCK